MAHKGSDENGNNQMSLFVTSFHIFHYEKQSGPPFYQNEGGIFSLGLLPSPLMINSIEKPQYFVCHLPLGYDGMSDTVNKVLFSRSRPTIDQFSLKLTTNKPDPHKVDGLSYAYIHIAFASMHFVVLFPFFCCMTLVRLKLEFGHSFGVSAPHTVYLPNLKFLHLRHIVFSDDESVQRLFSGCHMLEELLLRHCSQKTPGKFMVCSPTLKRFILTSFTDCEELMINAPNLVYFEHSDFDVTHYSLLSLHSLVEARIDVGLFTVAFFYQTAAPDLLRGISNTQSLHFVANFYRAYGLHRVPKFPNLLI